MIYSVPVSQTLREYLIITYFGSKESNSCKNIVNNLVLKHCYLYVILYFERQFINSMNVFLGKTAVGGNKTFLTNTLVYSFGGDCVCAIFVFFFVFFRLKFAKTFLFYYFHWVGIEVKFLIFDFSTNFNSFVLFKS